MSTYFKYAERNAADQINWAEIGKNLTGMLADKEKIREEKRVAIEEQTRADGLVLAKAPNGDNAGLNKWSLDFTNNATQARLLQERLLKKGILKPKDYTIMRQNLMDGTDTAFSLVKDASALYTEGMKRYQAGESSYQEQWNLQQGEAFGNFSKSSLYINPNDFSVNVAMRTIDPKTGLMSIDKSQDTFHSISSLRAMLTEKLDRFDVEGILKKGVGTLGEFVDATGIGGLKSIEDAMRRPEYAKMESSYLDSLLTNPTSVGSILTDFIKNDKKGNAFDFTTDKAIADKDPSMILLIADPTSSSGRLVPQVTPELMAYAKEKLQLRMRSMIKHKEEAKQEFAPQQETEGHAALGAAKKQTEQVANMLGKLYYGDPTEVEASLQYFKGAKADVLNIERKSDGVYITYKDGTKSTVKFKGADGKNMSQTDFIRSATELSGNPDINSGLKQGNPDLNRPFNENSTGTASRTGAASGVLAPKSFAGTKISTPNPVAKGAPILKPAAQYFDETVQAASGMSMTKGITVAKSFATAAETILGQLPQNITSGLEVSAIESDSTPIGESSVTRIYLPNVMDKPLLIPATKGNAMKTSMKTILRKIYDAAYNGTKIKSVELSPYFESGQYKKYNNPVMLEGTGGSTSSQSSGSAAGAASQF